MIAEQIKKDALERFRRGLGVAFDHPRGTVYLIPMAVCRDGRGVIIAQENSGCLRYDGLLPLQIFDLYGAGFPVEVSENIMELMHALFGKPVSEETQQGAMPRLLEKK